MATFEQLTPKINPERLKELTGLKPGHVLDNGNFYYDIGTNSMRAGIFIPMTKGEWDSLWTRPEPKCACEQEPEPEPEVGDTFDLTKAEVRLLQELRKQRASDEQLAALPKLHKRAASYPATPPPGYIKHIVKPVEIDFTNYQGQDHS